MLDAVSPVAAWETSRCATRSAGCSTATSSPPSTCPRTTTAPWMDTRCARPTSRRRGHTRLAVVGTALAGEAFSGSVGAGQAVRVMTGAVLPRGADVVVPQESARPMASSRSGRRRARRPARPPRGRGPRAGAAGLARRPARRRRRARPARLARHRRSVGPAAAARGHPVHRRRGRVDRPRARAGTDLRQQPLHAHCRAATPGRRAPRPRRRARRPARA